VLAAAAAVAVWCGGRGRFANYFDGLCLRRVQHLRRGTRALLGSALRSGEEEATKDVPVSAVPVLFYPIAVCVLS